MKHLALLTAATLSVLSVPAYAQSANIKVSAGHFCAENKCVRFSDDLSKVSIQARRPVSVESYGLRNNPVISSAEYREIFLLALRQRGVGDRG